MIHELFTENRSTIISVNSHFKIKIKFFWCTGEYSAAICASNSCKPSETSSGCFLVLRKLLFVSFCVVVWVLFSVFSIFCITSLVSATPRNHPSSASITSQKTDCMTSECALDKKLLHCFRESYHWVYLAYVR